MADMYLSLIMTSIIPLCNIQIVLQVLGFSDTYWCNDMQVVKTKHSAGLSSCSIAMALLGGKTPGDEMKEKTIL